MSGEDELLGFVSWVATHRAYNGSDHKHGQSLYNECINAVLPTWAVEYLAEHQPTAREADEAGGVTSCNYGVHPFQFQAALSGRDHHVHECPKCGASYIRSGADGCGECTAQPAPVASAPEVRLSEDELLQLRQVIAEGYYDHTIDVRAAAWFERILAARLAAAEQRVTERLAAAWDEGWRAGRGRGPGHTDACPSGGTRHDNPYRGDRR